MQLATGPTLALKDLEGVVHPGGHFLSSFDSFRSEDRYSAIGDAMSGTALVLEGSPGLRGRRHDRPGARSRRRPSTHPRARPAEPGRGGSVATPARSGRSTERTSSGASQRFVAHFRIGQPQPGTPPASAGSGGCGHCGRSPPTSIARRAPLHRQVREFVASGLAPLRCAAHRQAQQVEATGDPPPAPEPDNRGQVT